MLLTSLSHLIAESTELLEFVTPPYKPPPTSQENSTRGHLMDSCLPANDTVIYSPNIWVKAAVWMRDDVTINESSYCFFQECHSELC